MIILKILLMIAPLWIIFYGVFILPRYTVLSKMDSKLLARAKDLNSKNEFTFKNNAENQKTLIAEGFSKKDAGKITVAVSLLNKQKTNFFYTPKGMALMGVACACLIYGRLLYLIPVFGQIIYTVILFILLIGYIILFFRHKKKAV